MSPHSDLLSDFVDFQRGLFLDHKFVKRWWPLIVRTKFDIFKFIVGRSVKDGIGTIWRAGKRDHNIPITTSLYVSLPFASIFFPLSDHPLEGIIECLGSVHPWRNPRLIRVLP